MKVNVSGFSFWLCHLLAWWPWENCVKSLRLDFLVARVSIFLLQGDDTPNPDLKKHGLSSIPPSFLPVSYYNCTGSLLFPELEFLLGKGILMRPGRDSLASEFPFKLILLKGSDS